MSHAELSPSGAHRWMNCPGSVALCRGIESKDSVYSKEGTFAHSVAAACLLSGDDAVKVIGMSDDGFTVDADMAAHIQVYLDAVRSTHAIDGGELLVEQKVIVNEDIYGTADAKILAHRVLHIFDFKYGAGVYVAVEGNPQLLIYALDEDTDWSQFDEVQLHVVQPRHHHDRPWRTWRVPVGYMLAFKHAVLHKAEIAKQPSAPLCPGEWCGFCPAKTSCPALRKRALTTAQSVFGNLDLIEAPVKPPSPANLTPEQISTVLKGADIVKTWLKGVEDMAFETLRTGGVVPGFKLVEKRGNRKWTDEAATEKTLIASGLAEPYAPRELLSPAQAEKALGKKVGKAKAEALVETLAHKPVTGSTIVPASDPRPALAAGHSFTPID